MVTLSRKLNWVQAQFNFVIKDKTSSEIVIVGRATMIPYFEKSKNENLTSCSLSRLINIMPARAPIGVRNAPMLLPIMEANIASLYITGDKFTGNEE